MITGVRTLPPGTLEIFAVEYDAQGNEYYVGDWITYDALLLTPLPEVKGPSYMTPPEPKTTVPADTSTPGGRSIDVKVVDGVKIRTAEQKSLQLIPSVASGWVASEAAKIKDGVNATDQAADSVYSSVLELSGFDASALPSDAVITGIKVTVTRSKF